MKGPAEVKCSLTHYPSSSVGGHVAVHLHTLTEISVDVDGVDRAQALSVQQVLSTVLWRGKQSVSWGGKGLRRIQHNRAQKAKGRGEVNEWWCASPVWRGSENPCGDLCLGCYGMLSLDFKVTDWLNEFGFHRESGFLVFRGWRYCFKLNSGWVRGWICTIVRNKPGPRRWICTCCESGGNNSAGL